MFIETAGQAYRPSILNSVVAPRPIGWISTRGVDGRVNLAPFSYFNAISASPPMLMFAANAPQDRLEKDSLANVRATGEFCANVVGYAQREAMNLTSLALPHGEDEFMLAGLTPAPCHIVEAPRVQGAPAALECRVIRIVDVPPEQPGDRACGVVIARVVALHLDEACLDAEGRFDPLKAQPLARLGGYQYLKVADVFEIPRPRRVQA